MSRTDQMRAAWSRRTDEELLRAFLLEDLSADGRRVVAELVIEAYGPLDKLVDAFTVEQGDVVAQLPVSNVDIDREISGRALPLMWGRFVLAANGLGFIPAGRDDELGADDLSSLGDVAFGLGGQIVGTLGDSIWSGLARTMRPVANCSGANLPLPLLVKIEPNAVWLPHASYDEVLWGPDYGAVGRAGEQLLTLTPYHQDSKSIVRDWAARHQIAFTAVAPAPLLR